MFFDYFQCRDKGLSSAKGSRIEGIGRPVVEPSFLPNVVDKMVKVKDCQSLAAMLLLEEILQRRCGPSTGTNLIGTFHIAHAMQQAGESGPIVTLICDAGDRYHDSYYNEAWRQKCSIDPAPELPKLRQFYESGVWDIDCAFYQADA